MHYPSSADSPGAAPPEWASSNANSAETGQPQHLPSGSVRRSRFESLCMPSRIPVIIFRINHIMYLTPLQTYLYKRTFDIRRLRFHKEITQQVGVSQSCLRKHEQSFEFAALGRCRGFRLLRSVPPRRCVIQGQTAHARGGQHTELSDSLSNDFSGAMSVKHTVCSSLTRCCACWL